MRKLSLKGEVGVSQEATHQEHHVFQGSKVKGKYRIQGPGGKTWEGKSNKMGLDHEGLLKIPRCLEFVSTPQQIGTGHT